MSKKRLLSKTDKFKTMNHVVDHWDEFDGLKPVDMSIWLIMFRFERDGFCRVSQSLITKKCDVAINTVRSSIKRLINSGLITVVEKGATNRNVTKYRLKTFKRTGSKIPPVQGQNLT